MFDTKKYTTDGSDLRIELGYSPAMVTIENLTTNKTLVYNENYPTGVCKLIGADGAKADSAQALVPDADPAGNLEALTGTRGFTLPTNVADDINNTGGQTLVVNIYRKRTR